MTRDIEPCTIVIKKGNQQIELSACIVNITTKQEYYPLNSFGGDTSIIRGKPQIEIHAIGVPERRATIVKEAVLEEVEEYIPSRRYNFDD